MASVIITLAKLPVITAGQDKARQGKTTWHENINMGIDCCYHRRLIHYHVFKVSQITLNLFTKYISNIYGFLCSSIQGRSKGGGRGQLPRVQVWKGCKIWSLTRTFQRSTLLVK